MSEFDRFQKLKNAEKSPTQLYLIAKEEGMTKIACIRMLRKVFDFSLPEAKEIICCTDSQCNSLDEYQEDLYPTLKKALSSNDTESDAGN